MSGYTAILIAKRTACVAACLVASPCFASLESANDALMALKFQASCRVNADLSKDCIGTARQDILTPAGRDRLSQLSLPSSANETMSVTAAHVIKRNGTRVRLPESQIVRRAGSGTDQGIDNGTTTTLLFQGLEVGGGIEYSTKEHIKALKGVAEFHESMSFEPAPQRYDSLHIEYAADRPIEWRGENLDAFAVKTSEDGKKITIDLIKPYYFNVVNEDGFTVRKIPRIELYASDKVEDHYGKLVGIYNKILSSPLPPRARMEVEKLKGKPRDEQVKSLVRFVGEHYRYLADYRLDSREFIPLDLAQVEQNGYGDCKDLTMLLTAMIRRLGMDAEPAFVVRGDYAPKLLIPSLRAPNHAIVRAVVEGKVWWIDATSPVLLPGYTPADLQDRWAIVAGNDGKPRLDTIPPAETAMAQNISQTTRFNLDGTSEMDASTWLDGEKLLGLMRYEHSNGRNAADRLICEDDQKCSVSRLAMEQMKPPYLLQVRTSDLPAAPKYEGYYKGELGSFLLPALNALKNYRKTGGIGDYNTGIPTSRQLSGKVSGIKLRQPLKACHVSSRWFDYDAEFRHESNDISYTLRAVEKVAWIPHDELSSAAFGKFLADAEACFEGLGYSYTTELPAQPAGH